MSQKIIRTALALVFISLLITAWRAQQTPTPATVQARLGPAKESQEDRIALYQALLDLTNPWTVMCIAAHPDDEDGTSLIVMRRKYGAHTVSVFSTFGEGGQNAIGPELYEELGAIRARETMAAAEIQGSEPSFLGLKDFGYSKSADETFQKWGHDEALRRMVLQIRKLQPDVIITNHSVTNNDHGHHQATARLVLEAFDAAADPKRFAEQLKDGMTVWQVQRLFVRAGRSNQAQAETAPTVTIDPNERDPIRDTTFAEEALRALQKHATQGPWPKTFADMLRFRNAQNGKLPSIRYVLVREAKGVAPLPPDSNCLLDGLRLPKDLENEFRLPMVDGHPLIDFADQRALVLKTLIEWNTALRLVKKVDVPDYPRLTARQQRLQRALIIASGLSAKLVPKSDPVPADGQFHLTFEISNNGNSDLRINPLRFGAGDTGRTIIMHPVATVNKILAPGQTFSHGLDYSVPASSKITVPHQEHLYDGLFIGYPFAASAVVQIGDLPFEVLVGTSVGVAPAVEIESITPSPAVVIPTTVNRPITFMLRLINHRSAVFKGTLSAQGESLRVSLPAEASENIQFKLSRGLQARTAELKFTIAGSASVSSNISVVFSDAGVAPNLRVGYIRGFDLSLPHALNALGVESKELSIDEMKTSDLQRYSAIIVDNRVYESQPGLIATNQRLLDYAKDGGTLIVFYHKSNEWNPDPKHNRPQLAPYSLVLGDERITDENAPITFIEPQHPLLNSPNKMGQEDFAGWIQERGLYYPKDWDAHYHVLLQSNDPGEQPLRGGLLVADYGRGHYIYTSMVWYRQLRAGVPGAYRMLANMISYGRER